MPTTTLKNWAHALVNRRIGVMVLLGFASGLPVVLTDTVMQAWLTEAGVDLETIGLFSLVGLPYVLKMFWAPLLDRYALPWLGRRRGWMLLLQLILVGLIASIGLVPPDKAPWALAAAALLLSFISASQDIVLDAYRTDVLPPRERGFGAAVWVSAWRFAAYLGFAVTLIVAGLTNWTTAWFVMAGLMAIGLIGTLWGPEPKDPGLPPPTLFKAIVEPFKEFLTRRNAIALLVMIVLYKFGDAFAGKLTIAFLLRGMEYTQIEIGAYYKVVALAATFGGALLGGVLMARWRLFTSLMAFGVLQAVTNLLFMFMATQEKSIELLVTVIAMENLAGGMGTAAFVAFVMALCHHNYTATQFALLTALASLGRVLVGPVAGYIAADTGWVVFFFITTLAAIPGLLLLWWLRRPVYALDENGSTSPG